jgi:SPP1 gp7 family putative phage head morphogenesis protein
MKAWTVRKSVEAIQTLWDKGLKALNFTDSFFKPYIIDKSKSYQVQLEKGLDTNAKTLIQSGDTKGYQRFTTMRENVWQFGAGSVMEEYNALEKLTKVLKEEGKDISEESSQQMLNALSDRYQIQFKATEDATIKASAVMAEKWQVITQSGKNLKYVTVGDSNVRVAHSKLDGLVFPPFHPFWIKNYPPKDHGCRCDVEETNEPEFTGTIPVVPSDPGISGNSGITGTVFTDKHPYMDKEGKDLGSQMLKRQIRTDVKAFSNSNLRGEYKLDLNGKEINASFNAKQVKEFVSKYHPDENLRNEVIYDMKSWIKDAEYVDSAPNKKKDEKPWLKEVHYFKVQRMGNDFTLNVEEDNEGNYFLHALNALNQKTP